MKRFPLYIQRSNLDCGTTCLRMIAAFYGKKISMECINRLCSYTMNGTTMLGLKKTAEQLNFDVLGIKTNIDNLVNEVPLPCILYWRQEHFVVLYKVKRKGQRILFYVADPIGSRFKYTRSEIEKCWLLESNEGAALCLEPTQNFKECAESNSKEYGVLHFLWSYVSPYRLQMLQVLLAMLMSSALLLLLPFLAQSIIDDGIESKNIQYVWMILFAQIALVLGNAFVEFVRNRILLYVGARIDISMISDFILKLTKLPISFFDTRMTGDILQRIGDHQRVKEFLAGTSLVSLFSFVNAFVFGGVILYYSIAVFVVYLLCSFLYIGWVLLFMRKRAILDNKMFALNSLSKNNVFELIFGMQDIKLNTCEKEKRWEWERTQVGIYQMLLKGLNLSQYQMSGGVLLGQVRNVCITALVATLTIKGSMTLGMMLAIQFVIGLMNSPMEQIVDFIKKLQDVKLSIGRLNDVYCLDDETMEEKDFNIPYADICIDNISFRYDKFSESPVLDKVSLVIPKGKVTAIVGMSGSGKSTLLKLLLEFYCPDVGNIKLGEKQLQDYDIREWRKSCGVVMQDGFIYSDSIERNIVPSGDIDTERMLFAAKVANILPFIETLPLKFKTKIGREGKGLSSGQKQRLLIARAVYKNPRYLFMDEATNSLDANNEKKVMVNLNDFLKNRTSVIVAHRLSTVKDADNIIVLKNGQVIEQGTHQELLKFKGEYYSLIKNQLSI